MKIGKMGLFATPESVEVIQEWIEAHPPEERIHLYTAMGMTWNFLAELVNRADKFGKVSDGQKDQS